MMSFDILPWARWCASLPPSGVRAVAWNAHEFTRHNGLTGLIRQHCSPVHCGRKLARLGI